MTRTWVRILLWIGVMATAAMIYILSGQDGAASQGLSHHIVMPMVRLVARLDAAKTADELEALYWQLQNIVRTCAHISEYALLGFMLRLLWISYAWHMPHAGPFAAGVLYAATDEIHQGYVSERVADPADVAVDALGLVAGLIAVAFVIHLHGKWKRRKPS